MYDPTRDAEVGELIDHVADVRALFRGADDTLYVRWCRRPDLDLNRGYSLDHSTGRAEAGLSAQRLLPDIDDETLRSRLLEYQYLGGWCCLFRGDEAGRDSDGAVCLRNAVLVAVVDDDML